jgi:hypothetical protein
LLIFIGSFGSVAFIDLALDSAPDLRGPLGLPGELSLCGATVSGHHTVPGMQLSDEINPLNFDLLQGLEWNQKAFSRLSFDRNRAMRMTPRIEIQNGTSQAHV